MNSIYRPWRTGNRIGGIYVLTEWDLTRTGYSWMRGRLHKGDIVMCTRHSGDCFYDYILLEIGTNFIRGILESRFGSYILEHLLMEVSEKEFHRIMTGEYMKDDKDWKQFIHQLEESKS